MITTTGYNDLSYGASGANNEHMRQLRLKLDGLNQMSGGLKAQTFGKLPSGQNLSIMLKARFSSLESFADGFASTRHLFDVKITSLEHMVKIANTQEQSLPLDGAMSESGYNIGHVVAGARDRLNQLVDTLNTNINGNFLFSGRAVKDQPVADFAAILKGTNSRAGLAQATNERLAADKGADGLGRLTVTNAGDKVMVAPEDVNLPFGFKIAGISLQNSDGNMVSNHSDVNIVTNKDKDGNIESLALTFGKNPQANLSISVDLQLPDGSMENILLRPNQQQSNDEAFLVAADAAATAANFATALTGSIKNLANSSLRAASAFVASNGFFALGDGNTPVRIQGSNPATATSTKDATGEDTYLWYKGDASNHGRGSSRLQVSDQLVVNYGVQANERPIRSLLADMSAFVAVSYNDDRGGSGYDSKLFAAMASRLKRRLSDSGNVAGITTIAAEIANAANTASETIKHNNAIKEMHYQTISDIERSDPDHVALSMLSVGQQLQASYQLTRRLSQLSLINFL